MFWTPTCDQGAREKDINLGAAKSPTGPQGALSCRSFVQLHVGFAFSGTSSKSMMIFTRIKVTKMSIKKYLHDTAKLSWFWKEYFHSSKMKRRPSPFVARQMQTNVSSFLGKVASGCKSWLRSFLTFHHLYCKRSCNTNLKPFDQRLKGFPARTTSILT